MIKRSNPRLHLRRASCWLLFAAGGLPPIACAGPEPGELILPLTPVAASRSPLSLNESIALVSEAVACVIDSYQVRVHCIGRDDAPARVFGRRGRGPGELEDPNRVVRGPDETIGVIDYSTDRMSVFTPGGELVSEVRIDGIAFTPSAPFGASLIGNALYRGTDGPEHRQMAVDVTSGEVLWERVYPNELREESGCDANSIRGLGYGAASSGGAMVFPACGGHLIYFLGPDDEAGRLVATPTYVPELPNERDVRFLEELRKDAIQSGGFVLPASAVEEYRRTPVPYSHYLWFDGRNRLWVLTRRDRDAWSYLDVYDPAGEYAGTVRVRDRGVGFDILGSTLAVLVERQAGPDDADGIPDRAIDWYDIGGLEFGLRRDNQGGG